MCVASRILFFLALIQIKVNPLCSFSTFGIVFEGFSEEGSVILLDSDHGEQYTSQITTQEKGQGKTQLVSVPEGYHISVADPIAATCVYTCLPSFQRSSFHCQNQERNGLYEQQSVEMFQLQATEESLCIALCDMQHAMESCHRSDVRAWSQAESGSTVAGRSKHLLCTLARISARLLPMAVIMGADWKSSTSDTSKEIETEKCQGEQVSTWHTAHTSWQQHAATGTYDASGTHASCTNVTTWPNTSDYANDELGYASNADATAISYSCRRSTATPAAAQYAVASEPSGNADSSTNCAQYELMGASFAMPSMPKAPTMPSLTEPVSSDLMAMLKHDVADLPPHIQKAVKETAMKEGVKDGATATRNLHAAATHLGHMRKAYEDAILARGQLHSNWKQFLSDAVKLWQEYAVQFATQEKKLSEQIASAKEAFMEAKIASTKAHEAAGEVQEISDEEIGEMPPNASGSAQKITDGMEDLNKSLVSLQQQAMSIVSEEEVHLAKRPRTRHPAEDDATMNTGHNNDAADSGQHFG